MIFSAMKSKCLFRFFFIIMLNFLVGFVLVSCKSRMALCNTNNQQKMVKIKKNRNNYNYRYNFKSKPVRKDYVIKNSRKF